MRGTVENGYAVASAEQKACTCDPDRLYRSSHSDCTEIYSRFGGLHISRRFGRESGGSNFPTREYRWELAPGWVAGDYLSPCGREYVNNRFGANDTGVSYPTRRLRTVAQAETTTHGAYHPGCFLDGMVGTLATITFTGSSDRTLENRFAPIAFSIATLLDISKAGSYTPGTSVSYAGYEPSEVKGSSSSEHSATGHLGGEVATDKEQGSNGRHAATPDSTLPDKTIPTRPGISVEHGRRPRGGFEVGIESVEIR
jgi:hypothetical protein